MTKRQIITQYYRWFQEAQRLVNMWYLHLFKCLPNRNCKGTECALLRVNDTSLGDVTLTGFFQGVKSRFLLNRAGPPEEPLVHKRMNEVSSSRKHQHRIPCNTPYKKTCAPSFQGCSSPICKIDPNNMINVCSMGLWWYLENTPPTRIGRRSLFTNA